MAPAGFTTHEMLRFAGRTWTIKASTTPIGPGPNVFSADRARVDDLGQLALNVGPAASGWSCAEVIAQGEFGYGTYSWVVASDVDTLDARAVLGMFLWSDHPAQANRELDIEFSRWGAAAPPVLGSFTVQNAVPPNPFRFPAPPGRSQHSLTWTPGRVAFRSRFGSTVRQWRGEGDEVPRPGGGVAPRINLWLFQGKAPTGPQSVTIADFSYDPHRPRPTRG